MTQDRIRHCAACGADFAWTLRSAEETPPDLCPMCRLLAPQAGRQRGLVKWYSRAKGYGFITPAHDAELFVHKSGLADDQTPLCAGQLVEFIPAHTARGVQAEDVRVLDAPVLPE